MKILNVDCRIVGWRFPVFHPRTGQNHHCQYAPESVHFETTLSASFRYRDSNKYVNLDENTWCFGLIHICIFHRASNTLLQHRNGENNQKHISIEYQLNSNFIMFVYFHIKGYVQMHRFAKFHLPFRIFSWAAAAIDKLTATNTQMIRFIFNVIQ